ncbi:MAG: bestrophin family ion channel, partial [Crocinitomicaceae bacterium]
MFVQRRYPLKSVLIWTKRELIFFFVLSGVVTALYEILDIMWLQIPLTPVGLVGTAVAFMVGFQNNAAYDRIWEARKIWGGVVNTSRSLIIMVKDSFYIHNTKEAKDETEELKVFTNRHIAWLTALRYQLRKDKPWEMHLKSNKSNV